MFYKCHYFQIQELVDPETYKLFGERGWMLFHQQALLSLDGIRQYFGKPVIINNWYVGGVFEFRGFRPKTCTIGGIYSQHRFGNGFDLDVEGIPAHEVREEIVKNKDHDLLVRITCLEIDVGWVHSDSRNILNEQRILLVSP